MARHQSTRVLVVRIWCCPLNCPSAAAASVTLPAARAEMASAPPATQWSPCPVTSSRRSNGTAVKTYKASPRISAGTAALTSHPAR